MIFGFMRKKKVKQLRTIRACNKVAKEFGLSNKLVYSIFCEYFNIASRHMEDVISGIYDGIDTSINIPELGKLYYINKKDDVSKNKENQID